MDSYTEPLQVLLTHLRKSVHLRDGFACPVAYARNRPENPFGPAESTGHGKSVQKIANGYQYRGPACLDASVSGVIA